MIKLTPRQLEALRVIHAFQETWNRRPTTRELGDRMNPPVKPGTASAYIVQLHRAEILAGRMPCGSQAGCVQAHLPRWGKGPYPLTARAKKLLVATSGPEGA